MGTPETIEQKLARLEQENAGLKKQVEVANKPQAIRIKVSEKGGVQVNGLGRFPVTLYKEQMTRFLDAGPEIRKFMADHDAELKAKGDTDFVPLSQRKAA